VGHREGLAVVAGLRLDQDAFDQRLDDGTLLLKIAPRVGADCADGIARPCDGLPLALTLAGCAPAERENLTPIDYMRRLQDARARLDLVDASFSLSYELLSEPLRRLWCLLGVPGQFRPPGGNRGVGVGARSGAYVPRQV
jgi:hypothetical protein